MGKGEGHSNPNNRKHFSYVVEIPDGTENSADWYL